METDGGISGKSPTYILEKFNRYIQGEGTPFGETLKEDCWKSGLDAENKKKLGVWARMWLTEKQKNLLRKPTPKSPSPELDLPVIKSLDSLLWQEINDTYKQMLQTTNVKLKNKKGGEEDE